MVLNNYNIKYFLIYFFVICNLNLSSQTINNKPSFYDCVKPIKPFALFALSDYDIYHKYLKKYKGSPFFYFYNNNKKKNENFIENIYEEFSLKNDTTILFNWKNKEYLLRVDSNVTLNLLIVNKKFILFFDNGGFLKARQMLTKPSFQLNEIDSVIQALGRQYNPMKSNIVLISKGFIKLKQKSILLYSNDSSQFIELVEEEINGTTIPIDTTSSLYKKITKQFTDITIIDFLGIKNLNIGSSIKTWKSESVKKLLAYLKIDDW